MTYRSHAHELDGSLHDRCPECDRIRDVRPRAAVDAEVARTLAAQTERAARSHHATRSTRTEHERAPVEVRGDDDDASL